MPAIEKYRVEKNEDEDKLDEGEEVDINDGCQTYAADDKEDDYGTIKR